MSEDKRWSFTEVDCLVFFQSSNRQKLYKAQIVLQTITCIPPTPPIPPTPVT